MRVLVVEPEKKPYVKEIAGDLESLQKEVDGYIEAVYPWDEPCAIVCDEESKLTGKPFNRVLRDEDGDIYDVIAGIFLIVGLSEDNFASLSDEYVKLFSEKFAVPELFLNMDGRFIVIQMK